MGRKTEPICMYVSAFRLLFSAQFFYKTHEGYTFDLKATLHSTNSIVRWQPSDSNVTGRNDDSKRYIIFSITNMAFPIDDKESVLKLCQKI